MALARCFQTGRCLAVFFVLSPFLLVEPATAWRDIVANRQIVVDRATDHGCSPTCSRYPVAAGRPASTLPVVALAAIGAVRLAVTDRRRALLLLSFPVCFCSSSATPCRRAAISIPILPIVVLTGGAHHP